MLLEYNTTSLCWYRTITTFKAVVPPKPSHVVLTSELYFDGAEHFQYFKHNIKLLPVVGG
jgi:hypothetical protein